MNGSRRKNPRLERLIAEREAREFAEDLWALNDALCELTDFVFENLRPTETRRFISPRVH